MIGIATELLQCQGNLTQYSLVKATLDARITVLLKQPACQGWGRGVDAGDSQTYNDSSCVEDDSANRDGYNKGGAEVGPTVGKQG